MRRCIVDLPDRFKAYEQVWDQRMPRRLPVIIRLDGNSFSDLTDKIGCSKPFDHGFMSAMVDSASGVLAYTGGLLAYTCSDEISIVMRNDNTVDTEPFLGNRVQKLASLCAARATYEFGKWYDGGIFDCRVFIVPDIQEAANYLIWRQLDCWGNAVTSQAFWGLAAKYGKKTAMKMLHGRGTNERQEICFQELGINCNDMETRWKRGVVVKRVNYEASVREVVPAGRIAELEGKPGFDPDKVVVRSKMEADMNIPRFDGDETERKWLMDVLGG